MQDWKHLVSLDEHFGRNEDAFIREAYPKDIWGAQLILVEEERRLAPRYQPDYELLQDFKYNSAPGQPAPGESINPKAGFGLRSLLYGSSAFLDRHIVSTALICANDIGSEQCLAKESTEPWFHYEFRPGTVPMGYTGRVLEDEDGKKHNESLNLELGPDMLYDFVVSSINCKRIAVVDEDGKSKLIYDARDPANITLGELTAPMAEGSFSDSYVKTISLEQLASDKGLKPISREIAPGQEIDSYLFSTATDYENAESFAESAWAKTGNLLWKLASIDIMVQSPSFLVESVYPSAYMALNHLDVHLGTSGRNIVLYDPFGQKPIAVAEQFFLEMNKHLLDGALRALGEDLKEVRIYDEAGPLRCIYKRGTGQGCGF